MIRLLRALVMAAAVSSLLAACGAASPPGGQSHTSTGTQARIGTQTKIGEHTSTGAYSIPPGNRAAAQTDAIRLVQELQLPSGSAQQACSSKPSLLEGNIADALAQRCLTVPGSESTVFGYVKQHPPAGSKTLGTGSGGGSVNVLFTLPAVGDTLGTRMLSVEVSAGTRGNVNVHVEAQSDWIVPRPAAEMVTTGAKVVKVIAGTQTLTVTDPAKVSGAVQLFNSLLTVQPLSINCPAFVPKHHLIVDFMASASGSVLAEANIPGVGDATECYPIKFSVEGRQMKGLTGSDVRGRLARILGQKLP